VRDHGPISRSCTRQKRITFRADWLHGSQDFPLCLEQSEQVSFQSVFATFQDLVRATCYFELHLEEPTLCEVGFRCKGCVHFEWMGYRC
jgi:hypothetical protein